MRSLKVAAHPNKSCRPQNFVTRESVARERLIFSGRVFQSLKPSLGRRARLVDAPYALNLVFRLRKCKAMSRAYTERLVDGQ